MSVSLDTVVLAIDLVRGAIKIWEKIQDGPVQMKKLAVGMGRLENMLTKLETHLRAKSKKSDDADLLAIITETREDAKKIHVLFFKWDNNIVFGDIKPGGIQVVSRFDRLAQAIFTLARAEELENLAKALDTHKRDINDYLAIQGALDLEKIQKQNEALRKQAEAAKKQNDAMRKQADKMLQQLGIIIQNQNQDANKAGQDQPVGVSNLTPKTGDPKEKPQDKGPPQVPSPIKTPKQGIKVEIAKDIKNTKDKKDNKNNKDNKVAIRPSPSPSPVPSRRDYKIIFVDPYNEGRSVIAASMVNLIKEWTQVSGDGNWRIKMAASAGFFVKKNSDCVEEIENLSYARKSFKLPLKEGKVAANATAVAALFDNKLYNYPAKKTIRENVDKRHSAGIKRNVFANYDYIVVFTTRELENMLALRKALILKDGNDAAPRGKGRMLLLGHYIKRKDAPVKEILEPQRDKDGSDSRENWNKAVSEMKVAIKGFLKEEMKWTQLESKAKPPAATLKA